jgi:hypothetical protein
LNTEFQNQVILESADPAISTPQTQGVREVLAVRFLECRGF